MGRNHEARLFGTPANVVENSQIDASKKFIIRMEGNELREFHDYEREAPEVQLVRFASTALLKY